VTQKRMVSLENVDDAIRSAMRAYYWHGSVPGAEDGGEFGGIRQYVRACLTKQGPVVAAKPADGMVSLEDVRKAFDPVHAGSTEWKKHVPYDGCGMCVASAAEISEILSDRLSRLTKPEPTVPLVDAAEGRTLEVPARAVHKMEYPEDVTYTHDPWANKDVCNLCGVYVSDQAKHTAWHGRAVRLMDNDTFDLIEHYNLLRANTIKDKETVASQRELLDKYDADNTALVQENAALKEQKKPENLIVCCSYCGDSICKESEWTPKVAEHMATCAKSPALRLATENSELVKENASLKEQVYQITRGGCGKPGHTAFTSDEGTCYCLTCELEQENAKLKARIDCMPNEPFDTPEDFIRNLVAENTSFTETIYQQSVENATLKTQLAEQLKGHYAPPCIGYPDCDGDLIGYEHSSKCIAARLAGKDGNHA